jgi:enoyl-CoA hydratase/carnithine racemase
MVDPSDGTISLCFHLQHETLCRREARPGAIGPGASFSGRHGCYRPNGRRKSNPSVLKSGGNESMAVVETERHGRVLVVRMNRPEQLNALNHQLRTELAETWTGFRENDDLEVAVFTGAGRAFCAGEDMKESLGDGAPGGRPLAREDPFNSGALEKPVIAAINGYAMGGGFMLVESTDLRVAVRGAVFEISEAKRWLLGGYDHGHLANLPYSVAMEMALGFRFTAQRFYEIGFVNRLVEADELIPSALEMADHLLTLPPASRVNTVHMMRRMRPAVGPELGRLADALHEHGAKSDRMESRAAFAEKRAPKFKGWDDPQDRYRLPTLETPSK